MKLLYLDSVLVVPSEIGQKKIEKALRKRNGSGEVTDEHGLTREKYEDLGIPIPKFFDQEESTDIDEEGNIMLLDEEMEWEFMNCLIKLSDFSTAIDNQQIGAVIYTKQGDEIHVAQNVEEIYDQIAYLTRPWNVRLLDYLRRQWYKIKYFRRKKVNYKDIIAMAENQPDYVKPTE